MTFKILKKHIAKTRITRVCGLFALFLTLFCHLTSLAQKYTFSHYDIEDGLIESQVNNLALDHEHRLWMATFGGACRFDGRDFTSYTRQNGMPTNFINNVFVDKDNVVWFGTQSGLMKLVNKKLVSCPVPVKLKNNRVRSIIQDGSGTIWFIINNRLFKVAGNAGKEEIIQDTIKEPVLCLAVDKAGKLYASVHQKGIYYRDNGKWSSLVSYPKKDKDFFVTKMMFDRTDRSRLLLLSFNGIFSVKDAMLQPYQTKLAKSIKEKDSFLSLEQDSAANLWVGTSNGAYYLDLKKQKSTHFVAVNGLSDNAITDIYNDADNNLWLASQGNGLYKYEGDRYVIFDRTQGLPNNEVVYAIAKDWNNHILLGINGAGLFQYDGKKLSKVKLSKDQQGLEMVQCLYTDKNGLMWIGTDHGGLWTYDKNRFQMIKGSDYYAINGIEQDSSGQLWIVTPSGCFYLENNTLKRLGDFSGFSSSIINAGKDSVIIGTQDGIMLSVNKKNCQEFQAGCGAHLHCF
ncbi:MAG: hypothetical protein JO080_10090 [Mucilaginibacter sp.]|nr:hypothetical protein [Mucilaginibacter sp.]